MEDTLLSDPRLHWVGVRGPAAVDVGVMSVLVGAALGLITAWARSLCGVRSVP